MNETKAHSNNADYQVGQDNIQRFGLDVHNPVFLISVLVILTFVISTLLFTEDVKTLLSASKAWSIESADWLFMIAGNVFVVFCVGLIFSPLGKIRLGGNDAKPEFSLFSWLSMLFAAGMGIGLMFWSVSEPVAYYTGWYGTPLDVVAKSPEAFDMAMGATMFHWGIHPWSIYGVVALALAFFTYNRGLPLSIRSAFYPIFGDLVWGWVGHIIDTLAVFATLFGLATSLGFGAQQISGGLNFLFDIPNTSLTQIIVIAIITAVATISVVRGLQGGVKLLSNINMLLAFVLLIFVIVAGLGSNFMAGFFQTADAYFSNIVPLSNWIDREDDTFYKGWTVFYWAWWISWSPFVGMFIARISKGRTVRVLLLSVLVAPTFVTLIWMSAFGMNALTQVKDNIGALANGISDTSLTMFQMFDSMPLTNIISVLGIFLVFVFFVTSSDSGSLVIDNITSGGKLEAPVAQRVFWAITEGAVAGALLFGGGKDALSALQAGTITAGLPFAIILLFLCFGTLKGLINEHQVNKIRQS